MRFLDYLDRLADGLVTTLSLTGLSAAGALVLGTLLAAMRVSPVAPLRAAGQVYVETLRNTPLPVLAVLFALGLPKLGFFFSFFTWAVLALTVYTAAFVCEALRSGINSVAVGQGEAARAIGLTFPQTMSLVVLPQAFRTVVPPLGNILIALTKNTAVAATIAVVETTAIANQLITSSVDPLGVVGASALAYLVITLPLGLLVDRLERQVAIAR